MKLHLFFGGLASLLLVGCGAAGPAADRAADSTDGHYHDENAILLDAHQAEELGLTYDTLTAAPFARVIAAGGMLEAAPGDRITLVATVSGIVRFENLAEGSSVNRGARLFSIVSDDLSDDNYPQRLADAESAFQKASTDYQRAETLAKDQLVTASQRASAKQALESARLQRDVLLKNAISAGRKVVAPRTGFLADLRVSDGDYVTLGQPLAAVAANRHLIVRADVPRRLQGGLGGVRSANLRTVYSPAVYTTRRLLGVGRGSESDAATLPVRFEIDNPDGSLTAGTAVEVFLQGAPGAPALTVPCSAMTEEQGAYYLYVRTCADSYQKRAVTPGASDGRRIEIRQGVEAGEVVVATGAYYVRLASLSSDIPHGHAH